MCLGAIYWARPARLFFAASHNDAAAAGFDDAFIYEQLATPPALRSIPTVRLPTDAATRPFEEWASQFDKVKY
jgi:guanine deaminase